MQAFIATPDVGTALSWLASPGPEALAQKPWLAPMPFAAQAAVLKNVTSGTALTQEQYSALRLWLISLLDTWGRLVYTSWVFPQQQDPGKPVIGLLATRPVRELLHGGSAEGQGGAGPVGQKWGECARLPRQRPEPIPTIRTLASHHTTL